MGLEVGINARLLWPGGVLVDDPGHRRYDAAVRRTKTLIADSTVPAILEATFVYDGVLVRVDALERLPDGRWRVNEVKSSTRIKDEHVEDLALQVYVLAGNGLELADAYLIFTNDKYHRGEEVDWNALFHRQDVTEDVISLLPRMPERIAEMQRCCVQRKLQRSGQAVTAFSLMNVSSGTVAPPGSPKIGFFISPASRHPSLRSWKALALYRCGMSQPSSH